MVKVLGLALYISILGLDRIIMVKNQRTGNDIRGYTQDDIAVILDLHNQYRRNTSSSNMRELVWNTDLENMAQGWTDRCIFGHNSETENRFGFSYVGENLFLGSGGVYYPEDSVIQWYDEIIGYNYENISCNTNLTSSCGHYTQVVWADTHDIGCGITYCSEIEGLPAFGAGIVAVCNYGPGGNYRNTKPYLLGESCTQCPEEASNCIDNLCSSRQTPPTTTTTSATTTSSTTRPTTTEPLTTDITIIATPSTAKTTSISTTTSVPSTSEVTTILTTSSPFFVATDLTQTFTTKSTTISGSTTNDTGSVFSTTTDSVQFPFNNTVTTVPQIDLTTQLIQNAVVFGFVASSVSVCFIFNALKARFKRKQEKIEDLSSI